MKLNDINGTAINTDKVALITPSAMDLDKQRLTLVTDNIKYAFSYDFSKADCVLVSTKGISRNVRNELKQCHNLLIVDFCDLVKI